MLLISGLGAWRLTRRSDPGKGIISIGSTPVGRPIPSGFVGLSLEFPALLAYAGSSSAAINPVLVALIRNLTPGQTPVLRIGGDSTDRTWWPVRGLTQPASVDYRLTTRWLRIARALAARLGARLILGVNLAADSPAIAAAEAGAFIRGIGRRYVAALEVGNEPDLYGRKRWYRTTAGQAVFARSHDYDLTAFIDDFSRWRHALPNVPLAGPAFAWLDWISGLERFLSAEHQLALVTVHRYPLNACERNPGSASYASISNLLGNRSSGELAQPLARYAAIVHAHGLALRIDELNSAACAGKGAVSDTFASALWALDTLFSLDATGIDGVNIHTFPGAQYQLFTFTRSRGRWSAAVRPEYYGLAMFAQAAPPGSRLLPVTRSKGPLRAWATLAPDGTKRLVMINKDTSRSRTVVIRPPGTAGIAGVERLLAPAASATSGVTFAGRSFGAQTDTGALTGPERLGYLAPVGGDYVLTVPAASAAVLVLVPGMTRSAAP